MMSMHANLALPDELHWQQEEHQVQTGGPDSFIADENCSTNRQLQHDACPAWLSSAVASLLPAQLAVWLPSGLPVCDVAVQLAWLPSAVLPSQLSFQQPGLPSSPWPQTPSLGSAGWQCQMLKG